MSTLAKYEGIIPAFYAAYDAEGRVSPAAVQSWFSILLTKGCMGFMSMVPRVSVFIRVLRIASKFWKPLWRLPEVN